MAVGHEEQWYNVGRWLTGQSTCLSCGKDWIAVWPLDAESLECPDCGGIDTVRDALTFTKDVYE